MKVPVDLDLGAATHTGRVRAVNEDDYLLVVPETLEATRRQGRLFVVADGMGGATGGSEASRIAVRTLASALLDDGFVAQSPEARITEGFERACVAVFEQSVITPGLTGMGTTLTALWMREDRMVLGHIGDSRAYRYRGRTTERLTTDHAVQGDESRLTRCVGGGRDREEVDIHSLDLLPGDRFALVSDGIWGVIGDAGIAAALQADVAQEAAEEMVRQALAGGGPDNCTAVVVCLRTVLGADQPLPEFVELEIPSEELRGTTVLPDGRQLRAPRWPWLVLGLAVLLAAWVVGREVFSFDPFGF